MTATQIFTVLAGFLAVASLAIYLFGIPPELKRKMERKALETMGENKASYLVKDQISKVPASDQEDVKELKQGLSNLSGGALKNPLGEQAGHVASQAWDSVQDLTKVTEERVASLTEHARNKRGG